MIEGFKPLVFRLIPIYYRGINVMIILLQKFGVFHKERTRRCEKKLRNHCDDISVIYTCNIIV